MAQFHSFRYTMSTRITKVPSKPSKEQKNIKKEQLLMGTYMTAINPHGNALKIFPPVFDILIHSRPTTRIVMGFLFENIKQGNILVELKWQKFVQKGYGNRDTFYRGLTDLKERKMIQKYSGQFYEINPDFVFKGNVATLIENFNEAKQ